MTDSASATQQCVTRALARPRTTSTFALQMLRDQQRRLELAARMKELRVESPYTQEAVADKIGLKLRSYQKAEKTGGISYEKLRKLAKLHNVEFDWLLRGEHDAPPWGRPVEAPGSFVGNGHQPADRLTEVLERLAAIETRLQTEQARNAEMRSQIDLLVARSKPDANEENQ